MRIFAMTLALGFSIAGLAVAGGPCDPNACTEVQVCGSADNCGHCGCNCHCQKYCRVVCEMKKVKKHVWVVECEEFCTTLPGRRDRCCRKGDCNCQGSCDADCGCCQGKKCDPCEPLNKRHYNQPRCGKMRTKKKLIKKEVVCLVPVYKCIVVYCCPKCECNECGGATPPPPTKDAKQTALPPAPTPAHTTQFAPMPPSLRPM